MTIFTGEVVGLQRRDSVSVAEFGLRWVIHVQFGPVRDPIEIPIYDASDVRIGDKVTVQIETP